MHHLGRYVNSALERAWYICSAMDCRGQSVQIPLCKSRADPGLARTRATSSGRRSRSPLRGAALVFVREYACGGRALQSWTAADDQRSPSLAPRSPCSRRRVGDAVPRCVEARLSTPVRTPLSTYPSLLSACLSTKPAMPTHLLNRAACVGNYASSTSLTFSASSSISIGLRMKPVSSGERPYWASVCSSKPDM